MPSRPIVHDPGHGEPDIRDLADFHLRWREFREFATRMNARSELPKAERAVLGWLIALADRVSAADLDLQDARAGSSPWPRPRPH